MMYKQNNNLGAYAKSTNLVVRMKNKLRKSHETLPFKYALHINSILIYMSRQRL